MATESVDLSTDDFVRSHLPRQSLRMTRLPTDLCLESKVLMALLFPLAAAMHCKLQDSNIQRTVGANFTNTDSIQVAHS